MASPSAFTLSPPPSLILKPHHPRRDTAVLWMVMTVSLPLLPLPALAGPPSLSQSSPPAVYLSVATSVTHAILLELNFTPTLSPRLSVSFKGSHVFPGVIYVLGTLMCQGMGGGLSLSCRSPRTCPWSLVHTGSQESFPCWKLCAVHCSVSCPHVGMQDPATASAL